MYAYFGTNDTEQEFYEKLKAIINTDGDQTGECSDELSVILANIPTRGQPASISNIELFLWVVEKEKSGSSIEEAIKQGMVKFPDARPKRSSENGDPCQDFETLRREYFRFKERHHDLLDPAVSYDVFHFLKCLEHGGLNEASAIFVSLNDIRRTSICQGMNSIIDKLNEQILSLK